MPYFACPPMHAQQQQRQAVNALDPFLQAIFAQLQQDQEKPSTAATASQHPAATNAAPKPTPTPRNHNRTNRAFAPRFDIFETADAYHLHGDLPGVGDKKAINIEFSDERTLMVTGRVNRAPAQAPATVSSVPEVDEKDAKDERRRSLQPTVEDTDDEDDFSVVSGSSGSRKEGKKVEATVHEQQQNKEARKVWLSERTFGDFQRTFSFPSPVDIDAVAAKLEAGLLEVVVPKKFFGGVRKIEID